MRKFLIIPILLLSSCYVSDELAPDQDVWDYDQPNNQGLLNNPLISLNTNINSTSDFGQIYGLIVIKNDRLVFENYYNGASRAFTQNIDRAGLIYALAAVGIAEDQRLLSLDDPISNYLPEYQDLFDEDLEKENITIGHLLTHKSGLAWNESIQSYFSFLNNINEMKLKRDWVRFVLEKPLEAPPGLRFNYNTAAGVVLARVIANASGQSFADFLEDNLLSPLKINSVSLETDSTGNFNAGNGVSTSLMDFTKLGYLFLKEGLWKGRKIIDPNYVIDATTVETEVTGGYLLGDVWWFFGEDFTNRLNIDHEDIYYIPGNLGQYLYVIPEENMIISIFAENIFTDIISPDFIEVNPSLNLMIQITNTLQ